MCSSHAPMADGIHMHTCTSTHVDADLHSSIGACMHDVCNSRPDQSWVGMHACQWAKTSSCVLACRAVMPAYIYACTSCLCTMQITSMHPLHCWLHPSAHAQSHGSGQQSR